MGRDGLGEFEHLVLLAILRLADDAYGVPVVEEISRRTDRKVARASVYVALRRLEKKALIEYELSAPTPERGGRAKKYFRLTEKGLSLVRASRQDLFSMWDGLEDVVSES